MPELAASSAADDYHKLVFARESQIAPRGRFDRGGVGLQRPRTTPQHRVFGTKSLNLCRDAPGVASRPDERRHPVFSREAAEKNADADRDRVAREHASTKYQKRVESTREIVRMKVWKLWILVVAVVSGPWFGITSRPQWDRVTWIPFTGKEDKPTDMAANILLFVPIGWSFMRGRPLARGMMQTIALASVVSFGVEAPQLFFVLRDPSATDVLMGICGAAAGAALSRATITAWNRANPRTTSTN